MSTQQPPLSPHSTLVSAGRDDRAGDPLNRAIVPAANFLHGADRAYARGDGTPSWEALEEVVGALERAQCVAFSSGMAGIAAIFGQLPVGAQIVLPEDCYQGVARLAQQGADRGSWSIQRVPLRATGAWVQACGEADLIWLESPSNPLLTVADLQTICAAPRRSGTLLAVDNTFATALNQRPLDLGADLAFQSATKFIGGHSDLLAGVVTTRDPVLLAALREARTLWGATPGALEAFLATRGARTMALRLERAQQSAGALALRLQAHPRVSTVRYPGLPSHPSHAVAAAQLAGFGSILSFDVAGGAADADAVCARVSLIRHATSLGAVESSIERRASLPGQEHLPEGLLRLSVGIEDLEELWADLDTALNGHDGAAGSAGRAT